MHVFIEIHSGSKPICNIYCQGKFFGISENFLTILNFRKIYNPNKAIVDSRLRTQSQ